MVRTRNMGPVLCCNLVCYATGAVIPLHSPSGGGGHNGRLFTVNVSKGTAVTVYTESSNRAAGIRSGWRCQVTYIQSSFQSDGCPLMHDGGVPRAAARPSFAFESRSSMHHHAHAPSQASVFKFPRNMYTKYVMVQTRNRHWAMGPGQCRRLTFRSIPYMVMGEELRGGRVPLRARQARGK
ncbi:hypothetical protein JB92DRAFT_2110340 [Gautieria morchelliformis]|nr:hypothetical protein JB92DRAFT_2110340 [Gautieria morchelliformis]